MKQFYEVYRDDKILAPLVRELPWTHNLLILASPNDRRSERSISTSQSKHDGASASWNASSRVRLLNGPCCRTENSHQRCEFCRRPPPASSKTAIFSTSLTCRNAIVK